MMVAYIAQQGQTGAKAQAQILREHLEDVVTVRSTTLDADLERPYIVEDESVYPTSSLSAAIRGLDPDVVLVHVLNNDVVQELPRIQTTHPVLMRAGLNIHESILGGVEGIAAGLPTAVQALQSFDHLICPSHQTADDLVALTGRCRDRLTVIPSTISMEDCRDPNFNAPAAVGCLSTRVSPLKNQHTLVAAMGAMRSVSPTMTAPLYLPGGNQKYINVIQQTADVMGLGNRVQTGIFYEDPESEFFPKIGVHCMPSFSERLPLAVLEAARAGVPSIVAEAKWAEEFDSMLTAPGDDPWSWAERIAELLENDTHRVRVAKRQQEEVIEHFDVDDIATQYEETFAEVRDRVAPFKVPLETFERPNGVLV